MQAVQVQQDARAAWLAERRTGIGGSDIAAIMGLSPYKTPYEVWLDKTGQGEDQDMNEAMYFGVKLEALVAQEYAERSGRRVQRINQMLRNPFKPHMLTNIDRAIINPDIRGNVRWVEGRLTTDRILECKTASVYTLDNWGESGSDFVPDQYLLQCMWYLAVTGCQYCDLAVLIGGQEYRQYAIARDDELIAEMIAAADEFWNYVQWMEPPPPVNLSDVQVRFGGSAASGIAEADALVVEALSKINGVKAELKRLSEEEEELKKIITLAMGGFADTLVSQGQTLATWKLGKAPELFDKKAFAAAHPELAKEFTKIGKASRKLLIKGIKE